MKGLMVIATICALMSCRDASFKGSDDGDLPAKMPQKNSGNADARPNHQIFDPDTVFDSTPEGSAMKSCFKEWGQTPFDAKSALNYRTLTTNSSGFTSKVLADKTTTSEPALILVKVSATGFSSFKVDLGNPNGWYCLSSNLVGFSWVNISHHCQATIGNNQSTSKGFSSGNTEVYGSNCEPS